MWGALWATVSTPTLRLFHFVTSRAGQVIRDLLGPADAGVTVSDFYRAYDQLDGPHQRCWAHFLRDVHKLTEADPRHAGLAVWAEAVQVLYRFAVAWSAQVEERTPAERAAMPQGLEALLLAVCRAQEPETPQATLCARVERHHGEFFTFVAVPGVAPTNNAAERALRPLVIARKISGGTRSARGARRAWCSTPSWSPGSCATSTRSPSSWHCCAPHAQLRKLPRAEFLPTARQTWAT